MATVFNAATVPKAWVRQILESEHDDGRFEQFANAVVSGLEGRPVVGTSSSWDLGRDGRSAGPGPTVYVLTTLQADIDKPTRDAKKLKETSKPKRVYYVTARPHSEHTLKAHAAAIRAVLGDKVAVEEPLGAEQIADLVSSGKAGDAFKKHYAGEIASIQAALGGPGEGDVHLQQLELALSTFGATDTQQLRNSLGTRLILNVLEARPGTVESLAGDAAKLLGVEAFAVSTVRYYCGLLEQQKLVATKDSRYEMTDLGREEQAKAQVELVASELEGRSAVRAAVEASLGTTLAESHWSVIWVALQNELARTFYVRGKQLLDLVSALLQGQTADVKRDALAPLVDAVLARVVETHVTPPQRAQMLRALQDAFLPSDKHGAFEWLAGVTGRFAAVCTLGLAQEVVSSVRDVLRTIRFFFDTDVVISYLCFHEPAHVAAQSLVDLGKRLGHQVMITDAVAEEVARHAMKAHTDYRFRVAPVMRSLEWYELAELESAFTREFEYLRLEGKVKPHQWTGFIERYTGPEERGRDKRLIPNVGKMRQILSKESFAIRAPAGKDRPWQSRRDALARSLFEKAKRNYEEAKGVGETDLGIVQEKARIDAEMLIAVARTIEEAESQGTGERYFLVTSARRLRSLPSGVGAQLSYLPGVLSLPEAACLASLLPDRPVSLKALHGLLFEGHFDRAIGGLEAVLLQVVRQAGSAVIPGATRGLLLEEFSNAILREVKQTGEGKADVRARISKDPVAFARVAAVAIDALALSSPSERQAVLTRLEVALKDKQPAENQGERKS